MSLDKKAPMEINGIRLTNREIDVISCIINCSRSKKISAILSISPKTIETHIRNLMSKFGCVNRDSIIEHIEKTDKYFFFQNHYFSLLQSHLFRKRLFEISKTMFSDSPPLCIFSSSPNFEKNIDFLKELKRDLASAGLKIKNEGGNVGSLKEEALYIFLDAQNPSNTIQLYNKANPIFLHFPNTEDSFSLKKGEIDFRKKEKYYENVFKILFIINPKLDVEDQLSKIKVPSNYFDKELLLHSPPKKENGFFEKILLILTKRKKYFFGFTLFFLVSVSAFYLKDYFPLSFSELSTFPQQKIISMGPLPKEEYILERPKLLLSIKNKFKDIKEGIKAVAIVGLAGCGKTILARQYLNKNKEGFIWEINAHSKEALLDSFDELASRISKTKEDISELEKIQNIKSASKRLKKTFSFLRKNPFFYHEKWVLFYNNVETFSNIKDYFPYDELSWGKGKIIIVTQDQNIALNNQIGEKNTIFIGPLNNQEKVELFRKIVEKRSFPNLEQENFIKQLPPFPLDVCLAAYCILNSGMSYQEYLESLNRKCLRFSLVREKFLKDISEYTKTRYGIVTLTLKKILEANPKFAKMLLLISTVDSKEIPKELLKTYKDDKAVLNDFLRQLRKYSLIHFNNLKMNSFSLNESTQRIILKHLKKRFKLRKNNELNLENASIIEAYMDKVCQRQSPSEMRKTIFHVERFRERKKILTPLIKSKILTNLGRLYFYLGKNKKAESIFKEALMLNKRIHGISSEKVDQIKAYLDKLYRKPA